MTLTVTGASPATEVVTRFAGGFLEADIAAVLGSIAPRGVFHQAASLPWGGDWVGPEGFMALVTRMVTNLELELHTIDVLDAGPVVVVKLVAQ